MKLIWNGHACFTIATAQGTAVLDPYEDNYVPGLAPLKLTADKVLCSHGHRDHGAVDVVALTGNEPSFAVETISTFHDPEQGALRGPNTIHIISAEGLRVAHMGDLGCELTQEQIDKLQGLDAVIIPVGGFYTIDAAQAKAVTEQLKPRVIIPIHYRSETFGFPVLAEVGDFLSLCDNVVRYEGNTLELTADTPAQTAVLTYCAG